MMHLNPQSLRSPASPYERSSKNSFAAQNSCYPTTPQPEAIPATHGANSGLGLYGCALPPLQSSVTDLPPSPQPSGSWSHSSMIEREYPQSSQPPDIFSAAYDPFSGFSDGTNSGIMSVQSPEAPALDYCQTPPSSNLQSHRSSVSSLYSPADSFSPSGSDFVYTPRVKAEDRNEWYSSHGSDHVLQRGHLSQMHSGYSSVISPLNTHAEDVYRSEGAEWSKRECGAYPAALRSSPAIYRLPNLDVQSVLPSVGRIKKKRQRTTPEEATHECRICGKLFKRSYNWKSHMETHNPERKYPHPCTSMIGNTPCNKKFQRKTDLDRHNDSVHLKVRNHRCNLCGNRFARRDTLRRHTEDGCPKRFELGFRDGSCPTPARWSLPNYPAKGKSYIHGMPHSSQMVSPIDTASSSTFPSYSQRLELSGHLPSVP